MNATPEIVFQVFSVSLFVNQTIEQHLEMENARAQARIMKIS